MGPKAPRLVTDTPAWPVGPELLDFALGDSGIGLYQAVLDDTLCFVFISPAAGEIVGRDVSALLQPGGWLRRVHDDDLAGYQNMLAGLRGGQRASYEYRVHAPDGIRWVRDRLRVISAPDTRPLRLVGVLTDVTAGRSGRMLEAALQGVPEALFVMSPDGYIVHCNESFARMLGLDVATVRSLPEAERIARLAERIVSLDGAPVNGPDILAARMQSLAARSQPAQATLEMVSGEWKLLTLQRTHEGGQVFAATDITRLKRTEQVRQDLVRLLHDAVESIPNDFAIIDSGGRLALCNSAFARAYDSDPDMLHGSSRAFRIPVLLRQVASINGTPLLPDDLKAENWADRLENEDTAEVEFKNGSWKLVTGSRLSTGGIAIMRTDITHLKHTEKTLREAQEALRESGALVRQVLEGCPVPVQMTRLDDGEILYQNPASIAVAGEREASEARWIHNYFADPRERLPYVETLRRHQRVDDYPLRLSRADGESFPGSVSARLIQYQGEDVIVSTYTDLSDRLALEAQMARQREALHQSEKLSALGELLASVAHELNNPLSVVVGQALLLEETAQDPGISSRAARIGSAADRCSRIVRTFLAMARQTPGEHVAISLNEVIEVALEITAYGLRTANVEVSLDLDPGLPSISGDRDQFTQVITNLVLNAQHALQSTPGPRRLRVVSARRGDLVQVRVSDNGPGVPESIRSRIFEPLFTTKEVGAGTGIGLALCHRIVQSHGGSLVLERADRPGATFTIRVPVNATPGVERAGTQAPDTPVARLSVLVIDDDPDVADMLADILRGDGHRATVTRSASDALELIAGDGFDIVLSDLRMPEMDGPALHAALTATHPEYLQRLAFITGDTLDSHMHAFLERAARPYLEKPIRPDEVRTLVSAISRSRPQGEPR